MPRKLPLLAGGCVVAVTLACLAVDVLTIPPPFVLIPVAQLPIALVGALLIARVPRNLVGWLVATCGLAFALMFALSGYAWWALVGHPGLPAGDVMAAISTAMFAPAIGAIVVALLYYPSGKGLGGRWSWVERVLIGIVVVGSTGTISWPRSTARCARRARACG